MKKFFFFAFGAFLLAGCRQSPQTTTTTSPSTSPTAPAVKVATPLPRPGMDKRLAIVFRGAKIEKLARAEKGEFYAAKKGGKTVGRAALLPAQDAQGKALQILVVTRPDGRISLIWAGVPSSAGLTPGAAVVNEFLFQFQGKRAPQLTKFRLTRGMSAPTAQRAVDTVRRALILLDGSAGAPGKSARAPGKSAGAQSKR